MATVLGMRGTGDWAVPDDRPKNYREAVLRIYPNGQAPLTAIMSKMGSKKVDDYEFKFPYKALANQRAAVTGVYTDAILSTAYTTKATEGQLGDVVYFKMAAADVVHFRIGHQVVLRDASNEAVDVVGKVTSREANGASSYIGVRLLEADDNDATNDLSDCDTVMIISDINPHGGGMPEAISYGLSWRNNYCQIQKTPLSITNTARMTRTRSANDYKEMKREALEIHSIQLEKQSIFGIPTDNTGDNGQPEPTTAGLRYWIKTYASSNVFDYYTDNNALWNGEAWLAGGENWFDYSLEQVFRYGSQEKLALCGSQALMWINFLVKSVGTYNISVREAGYGIKVREWVTPQGTLMMMTHPLFTYEPTMRNSMMVVEPRYLKWCYLRDTRFLKAPPENETTITRRDALEEMFLTEGGYAIDYPEAMALFSGFGTTNSN